MYPPSGSYLHQTLMGSSLLGHTTHFHQSYMTQVSSYFLVTLLTNRQTHQTENIPSLAEVRIT